MNPEIKIAVCYRGQQRMIDQALIVQKRLIDSMVNDNVDIKFFGHTIASQSLVYDSENPHELDVNPDMIEPADLKTLADNMKKMKLSNHRIFYFQHLYPLASQILNYWAEQTTFQSFIEANPIRYHFINHMLLKNHDPDLNFLMKNDVQRHLFFVNQFELGNFISQYISAGHAYQMLFDYSEETQWIPDIVIFLRWDSIIEIKNINALLRYIENPLNKNQVLVNDMVITKSMGRINDIAFISNFESAKQWMIDIETKVFNLLTDWRVLVALSEFDASATPHLFWNFLTNNEIVYSDSNLFRAEILRPGVDKTLDLSTASLSKISKYKEEWRTKLKQNVANSKNNPLPIEYIKSSLGVI